MAIVWDDENKRMVDTENGEFLSLTLRDREEHLYNFSIGRPNTTAQVAGELIDDSTKEFETPAGGATVVRYILKKAWIPSGRREPPSNFDVPQHLIDRLRSFLEGDMRRNTQWKYMPRFEFIDERAKNGAAQ